MSHDTTVTDDGNSENMRISQLRAFIELEGYQYLSIHHPDEDENGNVIGYICHAGLQMGGSAIGKLIALASADQARELIYELLRVQAREMGDQFSSPKLIRILPTKEADPHIGEKIVKDVQQDETLMPGEIVVHPMYGKGTVLPDPEAEKFALIQFDAPEHPEPMLLSLTYAKLAKMERR